MVSLMKETNKLINRKRRRGGGGNERKKKRKGEKERSEKESAKFRDTLGRNNSVRGKMDVSEYERYRRICPLLDFSSCFHYHVIPLGLRIQLCDLYDNRI